MINTHQLMELFTNGYEGTAGNDTRYDLKDEMIKIRSCALLKNWISKIKRSKPQYTIEDFRYIMDQDKSLFDDLKKNVCWGDSFGLDQMFFRTGGSKRLIDYPDIKITDDGEIILIDGNSYGIGNMGVLTFDLFPLSDEDISNDENDAYKTDDNADDNTN